jgi:hypothetical protein
VQSQFSDDITIVISFIQGLSNAESSRIGIRKYRIYITTTMEEEEEEEPPSLLVKSPHIQ